MRDNNQLLQESDDNSRGSKVDTPAQDAIDKDKSEVDRTENELNPAQEINPFNAVDKEIDESLPSTSGVLGGQDLLTKVPSREASLRPGEPTRSRKRTRAGRYSSDITYQELAQYFHLPSTEACREIGLGLTAFKSVCRRFGLAMWPYKRPRKSHQMIWSEHHADPALREKKSDSKAVTRENSSQNQRSPDVRLDSDTAQRGLTAKPRSRSQVEHLQARDGDKKQYQAVPTVRSELNTDILKQILKYRERRNVSHTPRSLRREQPRKDSLVLSGVHQDMMMAASTSGMHGSEHARAMLSKVEHDLAQQKEIMNQDIRAKSMDPNDIMKFNQMVYLWNVLLLLDSIQDDYDDAGAS